MASDLEDGEFRDEVMNVVDVGGQFLKLSGDELINKRWKCVSKRGKEERQDLGVGICHIHFGVQCLLILVRLRRFLHLNVHPPPLLVHLLREDFLPGLLLRLRHLQIDVGQLRALG